MCNIASVVISSCTRDFDKEYHYIIPDKLKYCVKPGVRVIVPFGTADMPREGYVLDILEKSERSDLKSINKLVDNEPVLSKRMIELAAWMRERYICTIHDAIKCMLPAGIGIKSHTIIKLEKYRGNIEKDTDESTGENIKGSTGEGIKGSTGEGIKGSTKESIKEGIDEGNEEGTEENIDSNERKILDALIEHGNECELNELKSKLNIKSLQKHLNSMASKGIISIREEYATRVKEKYVRVAYAALSNDEIVNIIESNKLKRIQQIKVLEILMENEYTPVQDIIRFAGVSPGVLETLKKYGYIQFKEIEVRRDPFTDIYHDEEGTTLPELTWEQRKALEVLKDKADEAEFSEFLLHGVTGSGKTEVYMQLIQYVLEKGKEAILLVPEISLTPQMTARFKNRFGDNIAILHSRLSLGERYDQWRLIKEKKVKVVIGARSAIFAPFENTGLVIVDEEHEGSYKSEITPKYHAADIARFICKQHKCMLVLGSATPSVETYYRAEKGEIGLIEMKERPNNVLLPKVELVDMREELNRGNRSIFSTRLAEEINKNIKSGEQVILLLNRRGYSPFVLCRNCGYVVRCINCSIGLTYHAAGERVTCHYCGYTKKAPKECPKCKSRHIKHFGLGTQKLEEEVKKCFSTGTVIRMDSDTTSCKNSHASILSKFREQNISIMVGTQMVAKGHDFPNVTLVGVLAADGILNITDYRASERTFQLLTQVAGRAGRGKLPGRVVIQSYNTEDFSIIAACSHNYASFYKREIGLRREMGYLPFTNIATIIISGLNDRIVLESSKAVKGIILECFKEESISSVNSDSNSICSSGNSNSNSNSNSNDYEILGPMKPPIARIKNKYRWRLILKCKNLAVLIRVLTHVSDRISGAKGKNAAEFKAVELSMDINPVNML